MLIKASGGNPAQQDCDVWIVGVFENATLPRPSVAAELDQALQGKIGALLQNNSQIGRYGESAVIYTFGAITAKQIIIIGLGKSEQLSVDKLRSAAAIATRTAKKAAAKTAAFALQPEYYALGADLAGVQAIAEGIQLGAYEFTYYKSAKPQASLDVFYLADQTADLPQLQAVLHKAAIIADSVCLARDLVNHPACFMTPARFAETAREVAQTAGLELTVLQANDIKQQELEALWAVAKGSDEQPVLIVLNYRGNPQSNDLIAFIGKGITFDSGGISLKPSEGMGEMKDDMGGAAAVLGAMKAIGLLKPKVNVVGVIPCAENMPSGKALKPGDVVRALNGKTIEIISTDAEGRLILADALSYACRLGATKLVDLATLTGACVVALGKVASAVIANDEQWSGALLAAAERSGEKMWQLPAYEEYKEQIKSDIADLKNSGGRPAGAITAGLFLAEFTEGKPWVHIDIAGSVTSDKDRGYNSKGATGVGVRTLIELAEQYE